MNLSTTTTSLTCTVIAAGLCLSLAGCTEPNPAYQPGPELPDECRAGVEVSESFEDFERPDKVDLWFVVSDTGAMPAYQESVAQAVEPFLNRLAEEQFDIHAGVSTMDIGVAPGLAPAVDDVEDCAENSNQVGASGDSGWIETVQCNLQQGGDGDRRNRPLDVIEQSLVDDPASLHGFRRRDARLVIIMIGNQDDCSGAAFDDNPDRAARDLCAWQSEDLLDIDDWVESVAAKAQVPEGISVAAISGPSADISYEEGETVRSVCQSTLGSSYPSPRLNRATKQFGVQGLFLSSCVFDFVSHFDEIAARLVEPATVTICPAEPMAHEPLDVYGFYENDERNLQFGSEFVFPGATDACPDGAIKLRRDGARELERLEMIYCGL